MDQSVFPAGADACQLITRKQAAELLATSQDTVRRLDREGRLRACVVRGRPRYRLRDVKAFVERITTPRE